MKNLLDWLNKNKFTAHLLAFLLMILPPAGMYFAAGQGAAGWIWILLGLVILGNLLAIGVE
jgi:hypothetical protein